MSRQDGGFATIVTLGLCAVLLLAGGGATAIAAAARTHARAATAADAAALAAATAVETGVDGCARAAVVASANAARLSGCTIRGAEVEVTAQASPPEWLAWAGVAAVKARAGPADVLPGGTNSDELPPGDRSS